MTPEQDPITDLDTQVKESLKWVTKDLLAKYGLYVDKKIKTWADSGEVSIDYIHIFNHRVGQTVMSANAVSMESLESMDVFVREQYLEITKDQKFLAYAYIGRELVNDKKWKEFSLKVVDGLSSQDFEELSYFFENINSPSQHFVNFLKSYDRVFAADEIVRKGPSPDPQPQKGLNELRKPS